jgi:hypothetical protein
MLNAMIRNLKKQTWLMFQRYILILAGWW